MAIRVRFDAEVDVGPSTADFLMKYETLFDRKLVWSPRPGAPFTQMLEAPDDFIPGSTEPWIVDVVCALLKASDQRNVLECGSFVGATTVRLARTLAEMGGGTLTAVELEADRAATAQAALEAANIPPTVQWRIVQDDVLKYIASLPGEGLGFVWIDDCHEHEHVDQEIQLLLPKTAPNGILCFHDVHGSCALHREVERYGGIAIDLPRLGPAGGIGIIQVR